MVVLIAGQKAEVNLIETSYSPMTTGFYNGSQAAGNFDDDGFSDLLVSSTAVLEDALVRYGSPAGLPAAADATLVPPPLPAHDQRTVHFNLGDVNGDDFDDALVSYDLYLDDDFVGRFHALHQGSAAGLQEEHAATLGINGYFIDDVTGDGFDDVLVWRTGAVDLYLGSSAGLEEDPAQTIPIDFLQANGLRVPWLTGNLNGDGFGDLVLFRLLSVPNEGVIYLGSPSGLVFEQVWQGLPNGFHSVVGLADVTGESLDDLLVRNGNGEGSTYARYAPQGFVLVPQWWDHPGGGIFDRSIVSVFDADQDGFDDLLLGGDSLHLGSASGISRFHAWNRHLILQGPAVPSFSSSADFDGDGDTEVIFSASSSTSVRIYEARSL
jgi:hypothetical protein